MSKKKKIINSDFYVLNTFLANEAKERWDKLRRCYSNARNRRHKDTKSDMASKKKTIWKYEKEMSFILPYLITRK